MLTWHRGDVNVLTDAPAASLTHVLHLAAETDARLYDANPVAEVMTSVEGSRRIAQIARASAAARVLFASSGAVYGPQPTDMDCLAEDVRLAPEPTSTLAAHAYGQGKRMAETLLCLEASRTGSPFSVSLARGFAFSGAHLALDRHFAIGNFVRDAHAGGPVVVGGDGTPLRSYLDGADLARWLLVLLVRGGAQRAYNVGSDDVVSIASLAEEAAAFTGVPVVVRGGPPPAGPPSRYVPSIERARSELGLEVSVPRRESLARMFRALGRHVD
jgi:dTDP-glucose 4,6-dehydratase